MIFMTKYLSRLPASTALALLVAATLWLPAAAQTVPVEPAAIAAPDAQSLLLPAVQDAFVDSDAPTVNYGDEDELQVARVLLAERTALRHTLVQFDLAQIPAGSQILGVELGLFQTAGSPHPVLVNRNLTSWQESTVTWNERPRTVTGGAWNPGSMEGDYVFGDVTKLVDTWVNAGDNNPNFGLTLLSGATSTADGRSFHSRERNEGRPPLLRVRFQIPPIRICFDEIERCAGAEGAEVFDRTTGAAYTTDAQGYVADDGAIELGASLWARQPATIQASATRYCTSGAPVTVQATAFPASDQEMRIAVRCDQPLVLYDLALSAQWYLGDNATQMDELQRNIMRGSDYLYDFTDGQFALGTVTVHQSYEGWEEANIRLFASNTFQPNANVGGIVTVETPDPSPSVPISYTQGHVFMGSYWNRFGTPPNQVNLYQGQPVDPATLVDDWAIALAHELGHYLLFLFDTYTDANGISNAEIAASCTGSAMGNAYEPGNHTFVASQAFWDSACGETEAHARLQGRTEWDTIHAWHPWTTIPQQTQIGAFPPISLTQVIFISPTVTPPPLAVSQVFSLAYQAGETASGEARAFLIRDEALVFDQGQPPKHATTIQLTDARLGDRLCLYDVSNIVAADELSRRQFGCETIVAGDNLLVMTRDVAWSPLIILEQTGAQQLSVTVQQVVAGPPYTPMRARLFAEDGTAFGTIVLTGDGFTWQGVFDLPAPVPPVYLQVWLDETVPAPATRREVMADRGVGGNGAYGPARLHSGVLVVSSDGNAGYQTDEPLFLEAGQSIAWQSMPGAPVLQAGRQLAGRSYRLDALPPSLVQDGIVNIEFEELPGGSARAGAGPAATAYSIYFWNGAVWTQLPTTIGTPASGVEGTAADGIRVAAAPVQGPGIYAVLRSVGEAIYLPQVAR